MAEVNPPWFIEQSNAYNAWDIGVPYRDVVQEGVRASTELAVTQRGAGANNSVDVAAGVCWVMGDDDVNVQPAYRCYSNGVKNIALTQDATFHRIALIVAHVYDAHFSGATYTWALEAILGVASGAPVAPALPNNCLLLAQVDVPQVGTNVLNAQITDRRKLFRNGMVGSGTIVASAKGSAPVSNAGTTFATGSTILASNMTFWADGQSSYLVTISFPMWSNTGAGANSILELSLDGADAGRMALNTAAAAGASTGPMTATTVITPTVGSHTVNAVLFVGGGTATVNGGAGGAGVYMPITGLVEIV